jgi:hypothetical protein
LSIAVITASQQIDANLAATDTYYASQERALLACLQTGRTAQACAVALAAIHEDVFRRLRERLGLTRSRSNSTTGFSISS